MPRSLIPPEFFVLRDEGRCTKCKACVRQCGAPHHDIYSIEDLRQLITTLKEATDYRKPVAVKIAAVHNVAAIASGIARAGADIVVLDGLRGGTGAAPKLIRDHIGLPVELAVAVVDRRLREEGLREQVSLVASGGIRSSADLLKIVCLGADAVYLGTAALLALGCHLCQKCYTGRCSWGIATQDPALTRRLDPEWGAARLVNLLTAWQHEIKEFMGAMGINALESLRGNRLQLRGVGLPQNELDQLGVKQAGAGNTMSGGTIVVRGSAGDIVGYAMRGGKILIRGNAGWRVGIHMKSGAHSPAVLIIGGKTGDFLGEYMAGGTIVVLGLNHPLPREREAANPLTGNYLASGMHGGVIYIRGRVPAWQIRGQVQVELTTPEESPALRSWIDQFAAGLNLDCTALYREAFSRLTPRGARPYAHLYDHSA